jgi:putative endonuclease
MPFNLLQNLRRRFNKSLAGLSQTKSNNKTKGHEGELEAYEFLRRKGYKIVAQNYRKRYGEIDLIGWDQDVLAFIEVKKRLGNSRGRPEEAVHRAKRKQIYRIANEYRVRHRLRDINYRFDVVSIQNHHGSDEWLLIKNAFTDDRR